MFRVNKYRPRNLDFIVESERANKFWRSNFNVRQLMRELRARFHLDVGRRSAQDVIEQCNLLVRIAAGSGGKRSGYLLENSPEGLLHTRCR